MTRAHLALLLVAATALGACRHRQDPFVWVDALPDEAVNAGPGQYVIEAGDVLGIRVWNQEALTSRPRVRGDGKISLPLVDDVEAAGMAPYALARHLEDRLKDYLKNPVVTVALEEEHRAMQVSVVGEVVRPGAYEVERGAGVLHALALAGGMTEYAHRNRIFILRSDTSGDGAPKRLRIRFDYDALARGIGRAGVFTLRKGDVVVVE